MASSSSSSTNELFLLILFSWLTKDVSCSCLKSIIGFGDSLADTGNLPHLYPSNPPLFFQLPPYGQTFFHHPTGRCSDGRLIIDFIAQYLGLPLVRPFYDGKNSSGGGSVNFAVAGASALPDSFFLSKGIQVRQPNISLGDQLHWFKDKFLPKFYHNSPDRKKFVETSLVLVGEIGGNDYNHALLGGASKELVGTFVPKVVGTISSTIKEVIKLGATTVVVPGNFPIGCSATYLAQFKSANKSDYHPKTGCLMWLNKFARYHNNMLRAKIQRIQKDYPHTKLIYADYYNAAMRFYISPHKYGFTKGALAACCPKCGPYKVDAPFPAPKVCEDPSQYVSWDGLHLTEAAYRVVAKGLIKESYTIPRINSSCVC